MELIKFLKGKIISLDTKMNCLFSEKEIDNLIIKNIDLGEKNCFNFHSDVYSFGIQYTFFEDIEDDFGYRPNDVFLSIMVFLKNNKITIEQAISGLEYNEFPKIELIYSEKQNFDTLFDFTKISTLLLRAVQEFVDSRK